MIGMRSQHELRHSRTRLRPRYALFPLEGYPPSVLPRWQHTEARILTSPAMGADFVQYRLDLAEGGGASIPADQRVESFYYLLQGEILLETNDTQQTLAPGGFALIPPDKNHRIEAKQPSVLLLLRKVFEQLPDVPVYQPLIGNQQEVPAGVWMDIEGALLQTLIPEEVQYDMAMNIFTFHPGYSLPVVETHVMEHGLYFLEGKGLYYLDGEWMEVEKEDFIWMGPYVPQSFYATGPEPARYLYYKNVNREISL